MSATATTQSTAPNQAPATDQAITRQRPSLPAIREPRLPYHPAVEQRFGIDVSSWRALVESIFPGATTVESVILALSYCKARKLDVFKRVVHIVPIWSKEKGCMVDTIWPGIGELRTTAFRTGEYAGRGETEFGPDVSKKLGSVEMTFPEWARVSVFRMVKGVRVEFAGARVYWEETYATVKRNDDTPNDMWQTRPRGQIDKCAEAAALRAGFPEEIGCDYIPEEVQHQRGGPAIDVQSKPVPSSLGDLTAQLESKRLNSTPTQDYVTPDGRDPADTVQEEEPVKEPAREQPTAGPLDRLKAICAEAYEHGDLAAFNRLSDEWCGPEARWTEDADQFAEAGRMIAQYRNKLESSPSAKKSSKSQQQAFGTSASATEQGH